MLDTVGFYVPISKVIEKQVKNLGVRTVGMNQLTGEIILDKSKVELEPSYGRKIQFVLRDMRFEKDFYGKTTAKKGGPYFKIEFSACKYLLGRNTESIPVDAIIDIVWSLIDEFKKAFGITLPGIEKWFVYRLDLCANFVMPSLTNVLNFIHYCRNLDYGRKKKSIYSDFDKSKINHHSSGLYFGSSYETLKVYAKGPEYRVHDRAFDANESVRSAVQTLADRILRIELECKKSLLDIRRRVQGHDKRKYHYREAYRYKQLYKRSKSEAEKSLCNEKIVVHTSKAKLVQIVDMPLFNGYMNVMDTLKHVNCEEILSMKLRKLLNGTESKIMRSSDVEKKLSDSLGGESAKFYFALYMMLVTQGQIYAKSRFKKASYYKGLKTFRELGISFLASDIKKVSLGIDRGFPSDFSLSMSSENPYYQIPERRIA